MSRKLPGGTASAIIDRGDRMKSKACALLIGCLILSLSVSLLAADDPKVLFFYREGCVECERMEPVMHDLMAEYPALPARFIEEGDPDVDLMWSLAPKYGIFPTSYPVIFVGDEAIVGAGLAQELRLQTAFRDCALNGCPSPLSQISNARIPWRLIAMAGLIAIGIVLAILL